MRTPIRFFLTFSLFLICAALNTAGAASGGYDDLVELFESFREYQQAPLMNGIPDYSASAMKEHYRGLDDYRKDLAALETSEWPVWQQVDYHLVRAEMNAVEFQHKVQRPWARDPGFYSMFEGDAGATVNSPDFFDPVFSALGIIR